MQTDGTCIMQCEENLEGSKTCMNLANALCHNLRPLPLKLQDIGHMFQILNQYNEL